MSTKRRASGDGSIRKRADGRFEARLRYVDAGGKAKRDSFFGATHAEAAEKLRAAQDRVARGKPTRDKAIRLDVFLEHWLATACGTLKPSTRRNYAHVFAAVVQPTPLAGALLSTLRAPAIAAVISRGNGRERSRALCWRILKRALDAAVRWQFIRENPVDDVAPPRVPKREMRVWTATQVRKFLAVARGDRLYALYYLALHGGLRQGELLGLRWTDLDLVRGSARIQRTLDPVARTLSSPKTAKSARTVSLGEDAVAVLKAHQRAGNGSPFVFSDTLGGPLRASNLRRRSFAPLIAKAKLPSIRFHDLRHTAATLLLELGIPAKVVSERLGHSSISITADVYQHVSGTLERTAARKMTKLLASSAPANGGQRGGQRSKSVGKKKKTP